jgi:hypothetical protein
MKKSFVFILSLSLIIMFSTSCKKDFSCTCTYKDVIGAPDTLTWEIDEAKKKDAEEACENYTFEGWTDTNCTLD